VSLYVVKYSPHQTIFQINLVDLKEVDIRRRTQKFPDWPPGAITANGTALCH